MYVLVRDRRILLDSSNTRNDWHDNRVVDDIDGKVRSSIPAGNATLSDKNVEVHTIG